MERQLRAQESEWSETEAQASRPSMQSVRRSGASAACHATVVSEGETLREVNEGIPQTAKQF